LAGVARANLASNRSVRVEKRILLFVDRFIFCFWFNGTCIRLLSIVACIDMSIRRKDEDTKVERPVPAIREAPAKKP